MPTLLHTDEGKCKGISELTKLEDIFHKARNQSGDSRKKIILKKIKSTKFIVKFIDILV